MVAVWYDIRTFVHCYLLSSCQLQWVLLTCIFYVCLSIIFCLVIHGAVSLSTHTHCFCSHFLGKPWLASCPFNFFLCSKLVHLLGTDFKTCCLMKYEGHQCSHLNILLSLMLPSEYYTWSCVAVLFIKDKLIRLKCVQNPSHFVYGQDVLTCWMKTLLCAI